MTERSRLQAWDYWQTMMVTDNMKSASFMSPAEQRFYSDSRNKNPGWEPEQVSRAPKGFRMWDRREVFREITYQDAYGADFQSVNFLAPAGIVTPSGRINMNPVAKNFDIRVPTHILYTPDSIRLFCLFSQFDTLLEQQIMAFTGFVKERMDSALRHLYHAGVLEYSEWNLSGQFGPIWRMKRTTTAFSGFIARMDPKIAAVAFGGRDIEDIRHVAGAGPRSNIRHNILSAEVALRVMESCDNIASVWGDMFASEYEFHRPDSGTPNRNSWGDLVFVTKNGTINVIEIVAGINQRRGMMREVVEKAASWVGAVANSPLDINVLFVDLTWFKTSKTLIQAVGMGVDKVSKKYAPREYTRNEAKRHIGIIAGPGWFPEDRTVSQGQTRLMGYLPSSHEFKFFDEPNPEKSTPEMRRGVALNALAAIHTPPWILNDVVKREIDRY